MRSGSPTLVVGLQGLSHPFLGGMARYTEDLAKALADGDAGGVRYLAWRRPFPVALYRGPMPSQDPDPARDDRVELRRVLDVANPFSWERGSRWLRQADVVHMQVNSQLHAIVQTYIAARARRRPLVLTLHNVRPHDRNEPFLRPVMLYLVRGAQAVVVHNQQVAKAVQHEYDVQRDQVFVIPHPVYEGFDHGRWSRAEARKHLGIPQRATVALAFGAVRHYKGTLPLIEALRGAPDVHLIIAGRAWNQREAIEALAATPALKGRVHLHLDYVPDSEVELFFKAADFAVYPYLEMQGDSGALRLAHSFALPTIVSDAIPMDVGASTRVPRASFPSGLMKALRDPPSRPTETADASRISWAEAGRRTLALYERLL